MGRIVILVFCSILVSAATLFAQRATIPNGMLKGAVGSVATVPSGQLPEVRDLIGMTDLLVRGIVGQPHGYLSDDQTNEYTDYPIERSVDTVSEISAGD